MPTNCTSGSLPNEAYFAMKNFRDSVHTWFSGLKKKQPTMII